MVGSVTRNKKKETLNKMVKDLSDLLSCILPPNHMGYYGDSLEPLNQLRNDFDLAGWQTSEEIEEHIMAKLEGRRVLYTNDQCNEILNQRS